MVTIGQYHIVFEVNHGVDKVDFCCGLQFFGVDLAFMDRTGGKERRTFGAGKQTGRGCIEASSVL